ncbi:MAG TPA: AAA family ATPase, partial [Archangium sp.]
MMTTLRIHNFRCFRRLTVEGLTRVSLLVGANNAGKTSVLEAAELALGGTSPAALLRSPGRRGELVRVPDETGPARYYIELNHLFRGHALEPGSAFEIEAVMGDGTQVFSCKVIPRPSGKLEGDEETPPP